MRLRKKLAAGVAAMSIAVLGGGLAGVPATAFAAVGEQGQQGEGFQGQFGNTEGNVSPGQQRGQQN